jgi:hypothetical protein
MSTLLLYTPPHLIHSSCRWLVASMARFNPNRSGTANATTGWGTRVGGGVAMAWGSGMEKATTKSGKKAHGYLFHQHCARGLSHNGREKQAMEAACPAAIALAG